MDKAMEVTTFPVCLNAAENNAEASTEGHLYTQQSQSNAQVEHEDDEIQTSYHYDPKNIEILKLKTSPIDLRTLKSLVTIPSPRDGVLLKKQKNEVTSIAQLMGNIQWVDSRPNRNLSCKLFLTASTLSVKPNPYTINNEIHRKNCFYDDAIDFSSPQIFSETSYLKEKAESTNKKKCDVATNTSQIFVVNQGSQTAQTETKVSWTQTDFGPKDCKDTIPIYTCKICHQLWPTKVSYSRHLRTHVKNTNRKNILKVQLSTGAKLQVYKKSPGVAGKQERRPVLYLQPQPRSFDSGFECGMCEEWFPTEIERKDHRCVYSPIPMIKCPECPIQFYSQTCLNEHIGLIHKKENANASYNCIFCDQCFDTGYNFHVHLDNHLSQEKC